MNGMYTITITVPGTDAETSLQPDVESTVDAQRTPKRCGSPGPHVRWNQLPRSRGTAGRITIHDPANTRRTSTDTCGPSARS